MTFQEKVAKQRQQSRDWHKNHYDANPEFFRRKTREGLQEKRERDRDRDRSYSPIDCPCCKQPVRVPSLEIVVDRYKVTPLEARILGAVWKGRGLPVQTDRIFDAMYVDDPDGGPSPTRMYAAFKVALCHLRDRLEGSGITILNVGYRQGYRLVIGGN